MGKRTDAVQPAAPAKTAAPTPPPAVPETHPVQAAEPPAKTESPPQPSPSVAKDPLPETPGSIPAASAADAAKEPAPQIKALEQDKALAEKEANKKEKKSRVATDKKSKKSHKSHGLSKTPTDDTHLPPIPLPSKPAAIGGSGG